MLKLTDSFLKAWPMDAALIRGTDARLVGLCPEKIISIYIFIL